MQLIYSNDTLIDKTVLTPHGHDFITRNKLLAVVIPTYTKAK